MSVVWPSVGSIPQVVWLPMFDNRANTSVRTFRPGAGRKSYRVTREAVYPTAHSWPGPVWPCCQGLHPPRNRQRDLFPPRPASRPRENYRGSVGGSPRKTTNTLRVVAPDGSAPPPSALDVTSLTGYVLNFWRYMRCVLTLFHFFMVLRQVPTT